MNPLTHAFEKYAASLRQSGFTVPPLAWIGFSLAISAVVAFLGLALDVRLSVLSFVVLVDLLVGFPYFQAVKRVEGIEAALVDALKQMADTLKAGGTYEYSLRDIAASGHGPIQKAFAQVVRRLDEGENLETALASFADSVDSLLVKRSISLIVQSVRSGAGLADALDELAEDIRAMQRINRERKSSTLMQSMMLVAAAAFVAPLIFGFISVILGVLFAASAGSVSAEAAAKSTEAAASLGFLVEAYLFIEIVATSLMVSLMREGKASKSIIYLPILLFVAFGVYAFARVAGKALLVGGIA